MKQILIVLMLCLMQISPASSQTLSNDSLCCVPCKSLKKALLVKTERDFLKEQIEIKVLIGAFITVIGTYLLLTSQSKSGVGNYLKSEILYQARVSPHAIINNIPDQKILEIFKITLEKINTSYKSGGASVRDYSDIKGKEGTFSFTFAVYKKKKDPLGNKIVMEKTKDGRTTHWVPELQESFEK